MQHPRNAQRPTRKVQCAGHLAAAHRVQLESWIRTRSSVGTEHRLAMPEVEGSTPSRRANSITASSHSWLSGAASKADGWATGTKVRILHSPPHNVFRTHRLAR